MKNREHINIHGAESQSQYCLSCNLQSQNPHRTVGTGQAFIHAGFTGGNEAALFHYAAAGGIVDEMTADKRLDFRCPADMVDHHLERFSANALVPIWLPHPIAHKWFTLAGREIVAITRQIAHRAYSFTRLRQLYCPGGVIVKNSLDYFQAFLYRFMRWPACTRPHIRVGSIFEQHFGVTFAPWAQSYSASLKHR